MPGLFRLLIIAPIADQAGVQTLTGFHTNTALYTSADPTPRTQTHGWTATAFSTQDEADMPSWQSAYPNTHFEIYHIQDRENGRTIPQQRLLDLGLTTSSTV